MFFGKKKKLSGKNAYNAVKERQANQLEQRDEYVVWASPPVKEIQVTVPTSASISSLPSAQADKYEVKPALPSSSQTRVQPTAMNRAEENDNKNVVAIIGRQHSPAGPKASGNMIGRAILEGGNASSSQLVVRDFASTSDKSKSATPKQQQHMATLYNLSRIHLNAVPPERKQSLMTNTTMTDATPSGPIQFGTRATSGVKMNKHTMSPPFYLRKKHGMEPKLSNEKPREKKLSLVDLFAKIECCADNLCQPLSDFGDNAVEDDIVERSPLPEMIPIPREISISNRASCDHSFLSQDGVSAAESRRYAIVSNQEQVKEKRPSLFKRITLRRNDPSLARRNDNDSSVLSKLKIYVDKPPTSSTGCSDATSLDDSALTSPTMARTIDGQ